MSRSSSPPSPFALPGTRRASLVAGLALALVLGGLVIPHSPAEAHAGLPVGTRLDVNAVHPDAPLHMETSREEIIQACPACLLQENSLSSQGGSTVLPVPDLCAGLALPGAVRHRANPVRRLGPPRAPPALLSFG